jgi:hypothetical protein
MQQHNFSPFSAILYLCLLCVFISEWQNHVASSSYPGTSRKAIGIVYCCCVSVIPVFDLCWNTIFINVSWNREKCLGALAIYSHLFWFLIFFVKIIFLSSELLILYCWVQVPYCSASWFCFFVYSGQSSAPSNCCLDCPIPGTQWGCNAYFSMLLWFCSQADQAFTSLPWSLDHETLCPGEPH